MDIQKGIVDPFLAENDGKKEADGSASQLPTEDRIPLVCNDKYEHSANIVEKDLEDIEINRENIECFVNNPENIENSANNLENIENFEYNPENKLVSHCPNGINRYFGDIYENDFDIRRTST